MLTFVDNKIGVSKSPHSLGVRNALTIPSPGFDSNPLVIGQKAVLARGMSGLSFDGTGLLGTGLFSGDMTTWGWAELLVGAIGIYAFYSMFLQTKQVKARVSSGLKTRAKSRRVSKAASLRKRAKELEEDDEGFL